VLDAHLDRKGRPGPHRLAHEDLPVPAHREQRRTRSAALLDLGPDRLVLADDPEAGRLDELDLPVPLVRAPGDQRVQRRPESQCVEGWGSVV
jgi:hypothetical protein